MLVSALTKYPALNMVLQASPASQSIPCILSLYSQLLGGQLLGDEPTPTALMPLLLHSLCFKPLVQDMILSATPVRRDSLGNARAPLPWVERALRLTLFAAAVLLALTVYSSLGSVLSLVGGLCSLTCSLLLPTAFYTLLAWERLSWPSRLSLSALVVLSVSLIALTTASSLAELTSSDHSAPAPVAAGGSGSSSWGALSPLLSHS